MQASPRSTARAILKCVLLYLVIIVRTVREIKSGNTHSGPQKVFQDFHAAGLWTQRADDLHIMKPSMKCNRLRDETDSRLTFFALSARLYLGLGHARWCPRQDGIEPQLHHGTQ